MPPGCKFAHAWSPWRVSEDPRLRHRLQHDRPMPLPFVWDVLERRCQRDGCTLVQARWGASHPEERVAASLRATESLRALA